MTLRFNNRRVELVGVISLDFIDPILTTGWWWGYPRLSPHSTLHRNSQVFVAFVNNMITFFPVYLITYIFRTAKLRTNHGAKLLHAVEDQLDEEIDLKSMTTRPYDPNRLPIESPETVTAWVISRHYARRALLAADTFFVVFFIYYVLKNDAVSWTSWKS